MKIGEGYVCVFISLSFVLDSALTSVLWWPAAKKQERGASFLIRSVRDSGVVQEFDFSLLAAATRGHS